MLEYLYIKNFKSLQNCSLALSKLNLFFGLNCAGKSSVLQALLMLRQSYWCNAKKNIDKLYINEALVKLGTSKDILFQNAEEEQLEFYLKFTGHDAVDLNYTYDINNPQGDYLCSMEQTDLSIEEALLSGHCNYLAAEHIGPKPFYNTANFDKDGIIPLGINGQMVVPFLAKYGESIRVSEALCLKDSTSSDRLLDQTTAWLNKISPGVKINVAINDYAQRAELSLAYMNGQRLYSDYMSPVNVGFGVSYVLPLIVELLIANSNTLLLIENPESHLHPHGQSAIATLMALAAKNGAQIICESHSDHIINGVRVAVKEGKLRHKELMIAYFDKDEQLSSRITPIDVDKNGTLSAYPEGLLDEWGNLMSKLL